MGQNIKRIDVRNIVYNTYGELVKVKGEHAETNLKSIVNEIHLGIRKEDLHCSKDIVVHYVVQYILELYGTIAFGVVPVFETKHTKSVVSILNDLVHDGRLNKNWATE